MLQKGKWNQDKRRKGKGRKRGQEVRTGTVEAVGTGIKTGQGTGPVEGREWKETEEIKGREIQHWKGD
jgi:hypothetical protein